eukprot:CAMPEP_0181313074 /NCGR_PEP_ID=MMETSP1101-20121128/14051_1 /TAXON_ID=46948 /ORGANISM="Rhodomonas abbreviata, Strain Caron Lab Isolate" /LENGTH=127 /DNA_ID=CAMNT_0023419997 /DNA_START=141 /DNA_END=523 /DNA_ORIENTATION=-
MSPWRHTAGIDYVARAEPSKRTTREPATMCVLVLMPSSARVNTRASTSSERIQLPAAGWVATQQPQHLLLHIVQSTPEGGSSRTGGLREHGGTGATAALPTRSAGSTALTMEHVAMEHARDHGADFE